MLQVFLILNSIDIPFQIIILRLRYLAASRRLLAEYFTTNRRQTVRVPFFMLMSALFFIRLLQFIPNLLSLYVVLVHVAIRVFGVVVDLHQTELIIELVLVPIIRIGRVPIEALVALLR